MADNTTINTGVGGDNIATDDIAGVKYQRVKLIHGADGTNDGDVSNTNLYPTKLPNLEKLEDAAHVTGDTGLMILAVRSSTATPLAGANLDYIPLITDANGRLWCTSLIDTALPAGTNNIGDIDVLSVIPGTGATSLGKAEDDPHTSADTGVMGLAVRTDTPINRSGLDGDYEPLQMSGGRLWVSGVLTANSGVDIGDVDVTSVIPGTGATNLGKAEDAAHASGDTGVMGLAVRTDAPINRSGLDGDYEPLQMSAGRLWCSALIDTALPAGTNAIGKLSANSGVDIGDVDVTSVIPGTGATNLGKAEDAAHVSGDTGIMGLAVRTDTPANRSGADGDYEPLQLSAGRLWVVSKEQRPSTGTVTSVADAAVSTTLLASNAARFGATFFNDSTSTLYLKCGATASTTSYTVQVDPSGYWEMPHPAYTGIVDGIWSADAAGNVRVTEFT